MGSRSVILHPTHPALTLAGHGGQAGTRYTYPGGMEGRVDLDGWLNTEMVHLSTVSLPSRN